MSELSIRQLAYMESFYGVVVALAGNQLTMDSPTKETHLLLYTNCVSWVHENGNRLNIELKEEISKRENLFSDNFTIEPLDEKMLDHLKAQFPKSPTEADAKKVYSCWDCRNSYGPPYIRSKKEQISGFNSGKYTDISNIQNIMKKEIVDHPRKKKQERKKEKRNIHGTNTTRKTQHSIFL